MAKQNDAPSLPTHGSLLGLACHCAMLFLVSHSFSMLFLSSHSFSAAPTLPGPRDFSTFWSPRRRHLFYAIVVPFSF